MNLQEFIKKAQETQAKNLEVFLEHLSKNHIVVEELLCLHGFHYTDGVIDLKFSPAKEGYQLEWTNLDGRGADKNPQVYLHSLITTRYAAFEAFKIIVNDYFSTQVFPMFWLANRHIFDEPFKQLNEKYAVGEKLFKQMSITSPYAR